MRKKIQKPVTFYSRAHSFSLFKLILLKPGLPPLPFIYELFKIGDIQ